MHSSNPPDHAVFTQRMACERISNGCSVADLNLPVVEMISVNHNHGITEPSAIYRFRGTLAYIICIISQFCKMY